MGALRLPGRHDADVCSVVGAYDGFFMQKKVKWMVEDDRLGFKQDSDAVRDASHDGR